MNENESGKRWRLVLGRLEEEYSFDLNEEELGMDQALEILYDSERNGGLSGASPRINRWLGDIRTYFNSDTVHMLQKDAYEGLGIHQMLMEPEMLSNVEPDVHLAATLISLSKVMPARTRETAKQVVRDLVEQLKDKFELASHATIKTAVRKSSRKRKPNLTDIDWPKTLKANLKNYSPKHKAIFPDKLIGSGHKRVGAKRLILCVDQSASMATSVVYASIYAAVLSGVPNLKTHLILFSTSVVDMTEELSEPVEVLFGAQLGGGTDIAKALTYCKELIEDPEDTILVLISDLFEGGPPGQMIKKAFEIKNTGVDLIALLALNDEGTPVYNPSISAMLGNLGIPAFAASPDQFPELLAGALEKG